MGWGVCNGGCSADSITIVGGTEDETAHLRVGSVEITAGTYELQADSVEAVVVRPGQSSRDQAYLYDSQGTTDTFIATPDYGRFYGNGFDNRVFGFRRVTAVAAPSLPPGTAQADQDVALLYDSREADRFEASPDSAKVEFGSRDDYFVEAVGFRWVHGYASDDGHADTAVLSDMPNAKDTFQAYPTFARLYGAEYYNRAVSFDRVEAYSRPHESDVALLHDDPNTADRFAARPDHVDYDGDAFHYRADSFRYVHAYATHGGGDVALMHGNDDPTRPDTFRAWPQVSIHSGNGFYNRVKSFDFVHAYGSPGDRDVALLYGSPIEINTFEAWPEMARLCHRRPGGGYSFYNRVKEFDYVHAYGTAGGEDRAYLHGSTGNDHLEAWPYQAKLSGSGFYNRARSFRYVSADGGAGYDRAVLHDSVLEADYLEAEDNWAQLHSDLCLLLAMNFAEVEANSSNEGDSESVDENDIDFLLEMKGLWRPQESFR